MHSFDKDRIDQNTPLRLARAAALAFPDGSMTEKGLRREFQRGRLVIERIAGKDYTTLSEIEKMRVLCRVQQKSPLKMEWSAANEGELALAAAKATLRRLANERENARRKNQR